MRMIWIWLILIVGIVLVGTLAVLSKNQPLLEFGFKEMITRVYGIDSKLIPEKELVKEVNRGSNWDDINNGDGTRTKTIYMGTVNALYNEEYIPFEDYLTPKTSRNSLYFISPDNKVEFNITLDYELKNQLSIASPKFEVTKFRGGYYFTTNVEDDVNAMSYKIDSNKKISFSDDKLYIGNISIDFGMAKKEQNITTTFDSKTNKVVFSGKNLSKIDPSITLNRGNLTADVCLADSLADEDYLSLFKFDISSIPSSISIESAILGVYIDVEDGTVDTDVYVWYVADQEWTESISTADGTTLYNSRSNFTEAVFNNTPADDIWISFNVTTQVNTSYVNSHNYCSILIQDPDSTWSGTCAYVGDSGIWLGDATANNHLILENSENSLGNAGAEPILTIIYSFLALNLKITEPTTSNPKSVTDGDDIIVTFDFQAGGTNLTSGVEVDNVTIGGQYATILDNWCSGTLDCSAYTTETSCNNCSQCNWTEGPGTQQLFIEKWEHQNFNNWTNSNWISASDQKIDGYSAKCADGGFSAKTCDMNSIIKMDTSSSVSVNVTFWYRDDDCDAGDVIWYWNDSGGNWDNMGNIDAGSLGTADDAWNELKLNSADSQYLHSGFAIRFVATPDAFGGENYWVDNISIVSFGASNACSELSEGNCALCALSDCNTNCSAGGCSLSNENYTSNGWIVNVTVPSGLSGLQDLFLNATYLGITANNTQTEAINYGGAADPCDCPIPAAEWSVDCSDNCDLEECDISGYNLEIYGNTGSVAIYNDIWVKDMHWQKGCDISFLWEKIHKEK